MPIYRYRSNSSHLASIQSEEENQFLLNLGQNIWVGANDINTEGGWVWNDGLPFNFTGWGSNEPNECCGGQDCGKMMHSGFWDDTNCNRLETFICKK